MGNVEVRGLAWRNRGVIDGTGSFAPSRASSSQFHFFLGLNSCGTDPAKRCVRLFETFMPSERPSAAKFLRYIFSSSASREEHSSCRLLCTPIGLRRFRWYAAATGMHSALCVRGSSTRW